jgi:hypothetical protein
MSQNAIIAGQEQRADTLDAGDSEGSTASLSLTRRRWVGGSVGYVYYPDNTRFVGGCVGSVRGF